MSGVDRRPVRSTGVANRRTTTQETTKDRPEDGTALVVGHTGVKSGNTDVGKDPGRRCTGREPGSPGLSLREVQVDTFSRGTGGKG